MKIRKDYLLYSIIIASLLLVFIPSTNFVLQGGFTLQDSFWIIGSVTGLFAFVLFFWEYVLSIRSVVSYFTQDVISVINLHRWIGINSLLFILLHPITLILDSIINRNELLIKIIPVSNYDVQVIYGEIVFILFFVIWISSYLSRKNLSFRFWKLVHYLTYIVLPLTFIHANQIGTLLQSSFIRDYIIFMMIVFVLIVIWRALEFIGVMSAKYTIKSIEYVGKDVIQLGLSPIGDYIEPNKGQFIDLKLRRFGEIHPFSVFYFDEESKDIYLAIKKAGSFTSRLDNMKIGDRVFVKGPYGIFTREAYFPTSRKVVLIAGGIGITPFIRFIDHIKKHYSKFDEVYLFYGTKTLEEISFRKYLESLSLPNLEVVFCMSRENVKSPYENGRINIKLIKKYLKNQLYRYQYFICGPQPMMDSVNAELLFNGVDNDNIYKEEFGW